MALRYLNHGIGSRELQFLRDTLPRALNTPTNGIYANLTVSIEQTKEAERRARIHRDDPYGNYDQEVYERDWHEFHCF